MLRMLFQPCLSVYPRYAEMSDLKVGAMQDVWKGRDGGEGVLLIRKELTRRVCRGQVHPKGAEGYDTITWRVRSRLTWTLRNARIRERDT